MAPERDHPRGSPAAADYVPGSPEEAEFMQEQIAKQAGRDWPPGHPAAADNPHRVEPSRPIETARDASRLQGAPPAPPQQPRES